MMMIIVTAVIVVIQMVETATVIVEGMKEIE